MTFTQRAMKFFRTEFPNGPILSQEINILPNLAQSDKPLCVIAIVHDTTAVQKQRAFGIPGYMLGEYLEAVVKDLLGKAANLESNTFAGGGNVLTGHRVTHEDMTTSKRIIIYTDHLPIPLQQALDAIKSLGWFADVFQESKLFNSALISYGGPDEVYVKRINESLASAGAKTWFFPENAIAGDKLHRMMSDGVEKHDRVIMVCSKSSLTRPGVMNEIEKVLQREAREGGTQILIPITLDNFVFDGWNPERQDLAREIRDRVVGKFPPLDCTDAEFDLGIESLLLALKINRPH